jgi:hypothetical protein
MKGASLIILLVGLLMILHTGYTYVTEEKVVELSELQTAVDNEHRVNWQPYIAIAIVLLGGVMLIRANEKVKDA